MLNPYIYKEIEGELYAIPNKEYWEKNQQKLYEIKLKKSYIPKNYWDIEFDDYKGELSIDSKDKCMKYAYNCKEEKFHNVNLYLVGERSCQKTMAACNIGKQYIKQGLTVKFVYASELIDLLMKSQGFSYIEQVEQKIKEYTDADLLIIDDIFDKEKGTYWKNNPELVITAWDKFLRRQISEDRRVVLTSNYSVDTVESKFGRSIYELIDRNFIELRFYDNIQDVRKQRLKGLWDEE